MSSHSLARCIDSEMHLYINIILVTFINDLTLCNYRKLMNLMLILCTKLVAFILMLQITQIKETTFYVNTNYLLMYEVRLNDCKNNPHEESWKTDFSVWK